MIYHLLFYFCSLKGEKPFPCPYKGCDKRFPNSSDRKKHLITHNKGKVVHVCQVPDCGKVYAHSSSLKKHIKMFHSEKEPRSSCHSQTSDLAHHATSVDTELKTESGWTVQKCLASTNCETSGVGSPDSSPASSEALETDTKQDQDPPRRNSEEEKPAFKDHMRLPVITMDYPGITTSVKLNEWYTCHS